MALVKKLYFFKPFIIIIIFLPPFSAPRRMTVPLPFAYTANAQGRSAYTVLNAKENQFSR